jgi:Cu2+-exporting ATPase
MGQNNMSDTKQYKITGMSCAACQTHIEKAVGKVSGVDSVSVSLLTNSMAVQGEVSSAEVINAVEKAGYGAVPLDFDSGKTGNAPVEYGSSSNDSGDDSEANGSDYILKDTETPRMLHRLMKSVAVLLVLMYFSMGHMLWDWPVPGVINNPVSLGMIEMLLSLSILVINKNFFINGYKGFIHGGANMDTLVAMGSGASFLYSLVSLFIMTDALARADHATVMSMSMKYMYFESAAMIPTLITVGKTLESYSKGRTTDALKSLIRLAPKTALLLRDEKEIEVKIEEVRPDDIFLVKPGASIPVDGTIISGSTAIDESALTGESIPVDKAAGDQVFSATTNQSGYITCRATKVGEDTSLAQIIKMVRDASATKAPLARIADQVSGVFVPVVIAISFITLLGWMLAGSGFPAAFSRAVSVLVIACPCALGLATPVAIMVGNGLGAKNGILYKTAASLELAGRIDTVVLDKTGTITSGTPQVTDVIPTGSGDLDSEEYKKALDELLLYSCSLEKNSEHPLSIAINEYTSKKDILPVEVHDFQALPGNGLIARINVSSDEDLNSASAAPVTICGGNLKFIESRAFVPDDARELSEGLASQGKTPLFFASGDRLIGIIAVADTIRDDSRQAVKELHKLGTKVIMLTGDNKRTAQYVANQVKVDEVIAEVLPGDKESVIRDLQKQGKIAMVGDGINDAPALTRADVGIAIGAGTDIAIDACDIVLVKSNLLDVPAALRLSRQTIRNIHENLFWAFFYNIICIPLAIGLYQALFGWSFEMKPVIGAIAMSLSSVTVCLNALRLNLFNVHGGDSVKSSDSYGDNSNSEIPSTITCSNMCKIDLSKYNKYSKQEVTKMTKTINIQGMMCGHCEANVKGALTEIPGVVSAEVSHEKGTAVVTLSADVSDETLKSAVESRDYKVTSIK